MLKKPKAPNRALYLVYALPELAAKKKNYICYVYICILIYV